MIPPPKTPERGCCAQNKCCQLIINTINSTVLYLSLGQQNTAQDTANNKYSGTSSSHFTRTYYHAPNMATMAHSDKKTI